MNTLSYNWLTKLLNLLNTINILWAYLSTYLKPLIQSIIQYFLKKPALYGVIDGNHSWFKNYL